MLRILATATTLAALAFFPAVTLGADASEKAAMATDSYQASEIIGTNVMSGPKDKIGDIDDVLISKDGTVKGVVADVGGFLGVGERHILLSWKSLSIQRDGDDLKIATSLDKKALEKEKAYEWKKIERHSMR